MSDELSSAEAPAGPPTTPVTEAPTGWFADQVRGIDEHPAVRLYGAILAAAHTLTGISWFVFKHIAATASGTDGICWPLVPHCNSWRTHLSANGVSGLTELYIALGLVSAALFVLRRARAAVASFVFTTVLGVALYALDYRLRSNECYMFGWCVAVFLIAPKKPQALQALVALFYFWAGTLKVNAEWISGAALYRQPFLVPDALMPAACVYVLFLEMALIWGLFAPSPRWRWAVYAQLLLFHAVSWKVVGFHYPLLMLGLTAIFPLVWRLAPEDTLTWSAVRADRQTRWSIAGVAVAFSSFQLVPRLLPGDTAVTGEGRLFALHMFDARVSCDAAAYARVKGGHGVRVDLVDPALDVRTRCDPITLLALAKRVCRNAESHPEVVSIDVLVDAKRTTDDDMRPLMHVDDFCNKNIEYSPWHHNEWIGGP